MTPLVSIQNLIPEIVHGYKEYSTVFRFSRSGCSDGAGDVGGWVEQPGVQVEVELRRQKGGGGEVREPRGPFFMGGSWSKGSLRGVRGMQRIVTSS